MSYHVEQQRFGELPDQIVVREDGYMDAYKNEGEPIVDYVYTLGGGECEFVIEDNMNETEGMGDVWFRCTNCDTTYDYYADDWLMKQNYCPHCGFKVRKAVKR